MVDCKIVSETGECLEEFRCSVAPQYIIFRGRLLVKRVPYELNEYEEWSYLELS